jgi:opacity protein-like surface antigen
LPQATRQIKGDEYMKQLIRGVLFLLASRTFATAQAVETATRTTRHQVAIQASGFFTRKVTDSGITYKPTSTVGGSIGYRYNINRWLGVEADGDYFRNSQKFLTSTTSTALRTNVYAATGAAVVNLPNPVIKRMKSYVLIGGGAMVFHLRDTDVFDPQFKNVIVFGGGADIPVAPHIAIRGQVKNFMYKAPDFGLSSIRTNKYAQAMVPSVGVVLSF